MMSSFQGLKKDFVRDWNKTGVYHGKGLIKDLPNWEEILNILNRAITDKDPQINIPSDNNVEIVYKDLIAVKTLEYPEKHYEDTVAFSPKIVSNATFFFSIFFNKDHLESLVSSKMQEHVLNLEEEFDIKTDYSSLKISLSDRFVPYEVHDWDTCIIHLAGTNEWSLRDKSVGLDSLYILEAGDILFFRKGVEHQLKNDKPRSSIVGRFTLGESHEQ